MLMDKVYIIIALTLIGLCFGSFVNAAVWRIKKKKNLWNDRSQCVHCHHKLAAYDLIPVFSWLSLKGKCRYCKKPISRQYPFVEVAVALFFVGSYLFWPYVLVDTAPWLLFGLWLAAGVMLAILFIYDLKWLLLPDKVTFPLIGVGVLTVAVKLIASQDIAATLISTALAVLILSGIYLVVFIWSKGKWIGFGDVKLGLALALLLGDWQLALLALFLANLIGCIVVIPAMAQSKLKRTSHIPFGPFLIAGFLIAGLFGPAIIDWYLAISMVGIPTTDTI